MAKIECKVCGALNDAWLCKPCTAELEQHIAELPAAIHGLRAVETRQAAGPLRVNRYRRWEPSHTAAKDYREIPAALRSRYEVKSLPETPWPYSPNAVDQLWVIDHTVTSWARHLAESRGVELPAPIEIQRRFAVTSAGVAQVVRRDNPDQTATLIAWLLSNLEAIRFDEAAPEIHAEFAGLADDNALAIFGQADQSEFYGLCDAVGVAPNFPTFAGPTCTALSGICGHDSCALIHRIEFDYIGAKAVVCGQQLHAADGDEIVRCASCGQVYPTKTRRKAMLEGLDDKLGTIREVAGSLTTLDHPVSVDMINNAITRRQIATYGVGAHGKLVRVGEVRAYLEPRRGIRRSEAV